MFSTILLLKPVFMNKLLLLIIALVGLNCLVFGQSNDSSDSGQYEFMTIVSHFANKQIDYVYITEPNGIYEKINVDNFKYKHVETTVMIDLLKKYTNAGWVLQSNNMAVDEDNFYFYYLLKKTIIPK
jgi:hypothetical protein